MSNGNHSKDLAHWLTLELWGPEEGPSFNLYHTLMSTRTWAYIHSINLAHLVKTKIFSNGRLSQYASTVTHMNLINGEPVELYRQRAFQYLYISESDCWAIWGLINTHNCLYRGQMYLKNKTKRPNILRRGEWRHFWATIFPPIN